MSEFIVHARQRAASRRTVRLGCEVVRTRDFELIGRRMIDLSTDGLQVLAEDDVALGDAVQVFFRVPFSKLWVLADASVTRVVRGQRRRDEGPSYGLRFDDLHPDVEHAIRATSLRFPPTLPARTQRIDYAATVRAIALS